VARDECEDSALAGSASFPLMFAAVVLVLAVAGWRSSVTLIVVVPISAQR
jgi:hypothetical protein